jgi:excisionase family DNA binding protein
VEGREEVKNSSYGVLQLIEELKMAQTTQKSSRPNKPRVLAEVLTLREAAAYLRVSEKEIIELAESGELPGRKIRKDWRFHQQALSDWLRRPSPKERLMRHAGAAKDDPNLKALLEQAYRDRGRSMTEDQE